MRYTLICIILLSSFNLQARNLFPEDYHLGGDDYTDAIQECIDIASQTGQKVELKGESYKVTGGKLKLRSNVTLFSQVGSRVYTCDRNNYKSIFTTMFNTIYCKNYFMIWNMIKYSFNNFNYISQITKSLF